MLGLAWLGRDSSHHAGAAQIPPPRCRQGPGALGSPTRPRRASARHGPARPLRRERSPRSPGQELARIHKQLRNQVPSCCFSWPNVAGIVSVDAVAILSCRGPRHSLSFHVCFYNFSDGRQIHRSVVAVILPIVSITMKEV
jgi:hypothetical protein